MNIQSVVGGMIYGLKVRVGGSIKLIAEIDGDLAKGAVAWVSTRGWLVETDTTI